MAKRLQIRVGSGQGNQVILNHPDVATEHLELFADAEGNVFITDLGSDQGVYVNGDRLQGFLLLKEDAVSGDVLPAQLDQVADALAG